MPPKKVQPLSDEYAKRFPVQGPSAKQIARLKAQGLRPLQVDVVTGDPAIMKGLKITNSPSLSRTAKAR